MSALLTTTMPYMKVVVDAMVEKGIRDDYIVLVGGAPLNEAFAESVGADAYCRDAAVAVETAKEMIQAKRDREQSGRVMNHKLSNAVFALLPVGHWRGNYWRLSINCHQILLISTCQQHGITTQENCARHKGIKSRPQSWAQSLFLW